MLTIMEKDLLINVEIEREKKSYHKTYDPDKVYYSPYFKLYLFKISYSSSIFFSCSI